MNNLIFVVPQLLTFLLSQFIPELIQCFPVTAGGKGLEQVYYCVTPGCAACVRVVFCKDVLIFNGDHIEECSGPPPPDSVCQHQGLAFVSTLSGGNCEFEDEDYIETKNCKDLNSTCVFTTVTSSSKHPDQAYTATRVIGVLGLVIVLL